MVSTLGRLTLRSSAWIPTNVTWRHSLPTTTRPRMKTRKCATTPMHNHLLLRAPSHTRSRDLAHLRPPQSHRLTLPTLPNTATSDITPWPRAKRRHHSSVPKKEALATGTVLGHSLSLHSRRHRRCIRRKLRRCSYHKHPVAPTSIAKPALRS